MIQIIFYIDFVWYVLKKNKLVKINCTLKQPPIRPYQRTQWTIKSSFHESIFFYYIKHGGYEKVENDFRKERHLSLLHLRF